jgi:hypothetical protein
MNKHSLRRRLSISGSLLIVVAIVIFFQPFELLQRVVTAQGTGTFTDTGQSLGNATSQGVALGDLDGNGAIDAFVANDGSNRVWLNNGFGQFSSNGQSLGTGNSQDVALGNVDGDSDLDAVVANSDGTNQVWLNNGSGQFSAGQAFDSSNSRGVALGDLNGIGGLDVIFANSVTNTVWFNNGSGLFTDSGQSLGTSYSNDVALGNLDGDADLDAFFANGISGAQPDTVWINQGGDQGGTLGVLADSGQAIGSAWSYAVALADLDDDGNRDAFTASWFPLANKVWLNNGSGGFSDSGQGLGDDASLGVSLGYVDGDGDRDAVVANNFPAGIQVWPNKGSAQFSGSSQVLGTDTTTYEVGLADLDGDGDLDIFAANFGPNRVYLNDAAEGLVGCILCYIEWLARFSGPDPGFDVMHHLALTQQKTTPQWAYYTAFFRTHSPELAMIMVKNPTLLWSAVQSLEDWTAIVQDLNDGTSNEIVSQAMVDQLDNLLNGIKGQAGPQLQTALQNEQDALDLDAFVGLNAQQTWDELVAQRDISQVYLPLILKNSN